MDAPADTTQAPTQGVSAESHLRVRRSATPMKRHTESRTI
jgi:hypothetical protein